MFQTGNCYICKPTDPQVKIILYSLLNSFHKILIQKDEHIQNFKKQDSPYKVSFALLLFNIFQHNCRTSKPTKVCNHEDIKNMFIAHLKIDDQQLIRVSNIKMLQIARYNFHTDILSQQVKSFPRLFPNSIHMLKEKQHVEQKYEQGIMSQRQKQEQSPRQGSSASKISNRKTQAKIDQQPNLNPIQPEPKQQQISVDNFPPPLFPPQMNNFHEMLNNYNMHMFNPPVQPVHFNQFQQFPVGQFPPNFMKIKKQEQSPSQMG